MSRLMVHSAVHCARPACRGNIFVCLPKLSAASRQPMRACMLSAVHIGMHQTCKQGQPCASRTLTHSHTHTHNTYSVIHSCIHSFSPQLGYTSARHLLSQLPTPWVSSLSHDLVQPLLQRTCWMSSWHEHHAMWLALRVCRRYNHAQPTDVLLQARHGNRD